MCGITGYIKYKTNTKDGDIDDMIQVLYNRGPDSFGKKCFNKFNNFYAMGHSRLSIIDLSDSGSQPMENNKYIISFNGEIYNYKNIRDLLKKNNVQFVTNSDTEVVLEAIKYYGFQKALKQFHGMWAFSLFNKENGELILSRDRMGVKPLYYFNSEKDFIFGSELKSIYKYPNFKKNIDKTSLSQYFKYGFIAAPKSVFKDTFKVEPGQYIKIDCNGEITKYKYWGIVDIISRTKRENSLNEKNSINQLRKILIKAFKLRMVSDVPVGVFLSGGIDSSLLVSILAKELNYDLNTFTIGFDEKEYDESHWAKNIASHLGTNHNELICTEKDALELVSELPKIFDEPFGDSSAIPTMLVSKFAKKKVKVALSADGADELFFGYDRYETIYYFNRLKKNNKLFLSIIKMIPDKIIYLLFKLLKPLYNPLGLKDKIKKIKNIISSKTISNMYDELITYFNKEDLSKLLGGNYSCKIISNDNIGELTFLTDSHNYLPGDILTKVDRSSMFYSLEAREPFLDQSIIDFSQSLPFSQKYRKGEKKYILKKLLENYLPKDFIYRKKKGFAVPIDKWLHGALKPIVNEYLNAAKLNEHGILNTKFVLRLVNDYYNKKGVNSHKIWFLLIFQMWYEEWGKGITLE